MSNTNKELTVFLDNVGRTIIGKIQNENESSLTIENPALVHIQANPQTNQLQLQILPLFFKEFQADKNQATAWTYKKANITVAEPITFAAQFTAQYEQLFAPAQPAAPQKVVKLFDEEE